MATVTELGYLGITVSDGDAWRRYATEVVGMELVDEGEANRFYLRMDHWHHRICVTVDGTDELDYVGWRVAGPLELDALSAKLETAGIAFAVASDAERAERRVLGLLKLADPGGNATEIFYGPQVDSYKPFHPGRPMFGRFVTGDQGLGHCILAQQDIAAALRFYQLIGLIGAVDYRLDLPGGIVGEPVFMHVNSRQHSMAFGLGPMERRIHHLMIEYTDIKDLGRAHDIVRKRGIPVALQLGMHANDEALSFYNANPSGWLFELGWGGRAPLAQQEHYKHDLFGHGSEVKGYGVDFDLSIA